MNRADHYRAADALVWRARRYIVMEQERVAKWVESPSTGADPGPWPQLKTELPTLWIAAAQVHATLASAGPGVEAEIAGIEKREAQALGAVEGSQRARQAARPPLRRPTDEETSAASRRIEGGWAAPGDRAMLSEQRARAADAVAETMRRIYTAGLYHPECGETDRDNFGGCDGPMGEYDQIGTAFGLPLGGRVKLCESHARQALKRERIKP